MVVVEAMRAPLAEEAEGAGPFLGVVGIVLAGVEREVLGLGLSVHDLVLPKDLPRGGAEVVYLAFMVLQNRCLDVETVLVLALLLTTLLLDDLL